MRSDLIFGAVTHVPNPFLLAKILAKATRRFHKPGTRIQDTTNDVLVRFGRANPVADKRFARTSANLSVRRDAPQPAIRRKPQILTIPAVPEISHAPLETFADQL